MIGLYFVDHLVDTPPVVTVFKSWLNWMLIMWMLALVVEHPQYTPNRSNTWSVQRVYLWNICSVNMVKKSFEKRRAWSISSPVKWVCELVCEFKFNLELDWTRLIIPLSQTIALCSAILKQNAFIAPTFRRYCNLPLQSSTGVITHINNGR